MYYVTVSSNNMLSILAGTGIEQPFRHQRRVKLQIGFSEYKEFVAMLVAARADIMYFGIQLYENGLANEGKALLHKLFYFDLYRAMCGEVILSINSSKESTLMVGSFSHPSEEVHRFKLCEAESLYLTFSSHEKAKAEVLRDLHRGIPNLRAKSISNRNWQIIGYLIVLRSLSLERRPENFIVEEEGYEQ